MPEAKKRPDTSQRQPDKAPAQGLPTELDRIYGELRAKVLDQIDHAQIQILDTLEEA